MATSTLAKQSRRKRPFAFRNPPPFTNDSHSKLISLGLVLGEGWVECHREKTRKRVGIRVTMCDKKAVEFVSDAQRSKVRFARTKGVRRSTTGNPERQAYETAVIGGRAEAVVKAYSEVPGFTESDFYRKYLKVMLEINGNPGSSGNQ